MTLTQKMWSLSLKLPQARPIGQYWSCPFAPRSMPIQTSQRLAELDALPGNIIVQIFVCQLRFHASANAELSLGSEVLPKSSAINGLRLHMPEQNMMRCMQLEGR